MHERAGDTQEGSSRWRWRACAGPASRAETVSQTLAHSYISPVLTAHPTEVQRKSILDAERDIADLLASATRSRPAHCRRTRWRRANWRPTRR